MQWLAGTLRDSPELAIFLALLLILSWQLTLVVLLCLVPALLVVRRLTRAAQDQGEVLVSAYTGWAARIVELLGAMRTIRAFGQEAAAEARMTAAASEVQRSFDQTALAGNFRHEEVEEDPDARSVAQIGVGQEPEIR